MEEGPERSTAERLGAGTRPTGREERVQARADSRRPRGEGAEERPAETWGGGVAAGTPRSCQAARSPPPASRQRTRALMGSLGPASSTAGPGL